MANNVGDIRWNAAKGFYQEWAVIPTPLGFPLPAWVRSPNQETAESAMREGYSNMMTYQKALRSGSAGASAPHTVGTQRAAATMAGAATEAAMAACPCAPVEHAYEATVRETGLRPLYRSTLSLAAGASGTLRIEANDAGAANRLYLTASDPTTGLGYERAVTIPGSIQLNSKPLDFGTAPNGTLQPWALTDPDGIGRDIGQLELSKTDAFSVPVTNNSAVTVLVEGVVYLTGYCPSKFLRK